MPEIKPRLTEDEIRSLLQEQFAATVSQLEVVQGGQIAQTYAFTVAGQDYVIRFNHDNLGANFEKEAYIQQHFIAPPIPMPRLVQVGRRQDLHFAIAEKAPGQRLNTLPPAEYTALLPQLLAILDAIHAVDVRDRSGYGVFDNQGTGLSPGWRHYLAAIRHEEEPWDFYGKWHVLFQDSFLERDVFDQVYDQMTRLLGRCPEDRYLVHGNYGFGNVLAQAGQITAVLDWIDAKYGDFVFDIAWLAFWSPDRDMQALFQQHYAAQGRAVPHFVERLRCYECYIGLDALRFFAKTQSQAAYTWARERILALLA